MFSENISRLGFQIIAILLFLYQMEQSIMKYSDSPTSVTKLKTPNKELVYEPYLIVCQSRQYNYDKGKIFGYGFMYELWAGIYTSSGDRRVTWKGKTDNLSFSTLSKELYDYDYSLVNTKFSKLGNEYFSLNLGMCVKLDDLGNDILAVIISNKNLNLLAVDPNTFYEVWIDHDPKASISIGQRYDGMFNYASVLLEYTVTDNSIENGEGCRVYGNPHSYKQCVIEALKVILYCFMCLLYSVAKIIKGKTIIRHKRCPFMDVKPHGS